MGVRGRVVMLDSAGGAKLDAKMMSVMKQDRASQTESLVLQKDTKEFSSCAFIPLCLALKS